jgi:uncharacterized repeat protein (TIGR02543 family)
MKKFLLCACVCSLASTSPLALAQLTYEAFLSGMGENPVNGSPGTGLGKVVLNAAQTQITVDLNWSGLTAPATAAHIHGPAGVGTNASVMFPFTGVPAATSGTLPTQSFSITPTQIGYLNAGYLYLNVHTANFPGGEIRAQLLLTVPGYTLTLTTNGNGGVTANPNASYFASNAVVSLTATSATNYLFTGWSGSASGSANPLSITMTNNKAITANFAFATNGVATTINLAAQLAWFAQTNLHYQIQAASVLNSNAWFDLGALIAGNNATNYYYDPLAGNPGRFYRVMTRP